MRLAKRCNSANWYLEARIGGRTFVRSTKSAHKPNAKKIAEGIFRLLQIEAAQGPSKNISLKEAADRYMVVRAGTPSARNLRGVESVVLKLIDGRRLLSEITGRDLSDFVNRRKSEGCAAQTIKHGVTFICAVMKQARREGFAVSSIEAPVIPIKPTRLRYLSREEENHLLAELHPSRTGRGIPEQHLRPERIGRELQDNYDIVVLLLDTGARYGEIAKLRWDQIDLSERSIKLWRSKVSNESIIFMTSRAFEVLCRRSAEKSGEHVFTNRKGGPRGPNCTAIRRAIRRADLHDCTIHTLRHTHATRLIQNGLSIYEVRSVLGHTDIKTTMRYAHLENVDVNQKARNVIEALNEAGALPQA